MDAESRISKARIDYTLNSGPEKSEKLSLTEIAEAIRSCGEEKEIVESGQFLNLILYNTSDEEQRSRKKQVVTEVLLKLLDQTVQIPLLARDALVALYDSAEDLQLLALANLVVCDLQLPKVQQQTVVGIMESSETGSASERFQLLSASLAMGRAMAAIPKELTNLLIYSCGVLAKAQQELHLPALLCVRAYLNHGRVIAGSLPSDLPSGRDVVERFCQKILKHRPLPMSRECVLLLLLTAASPLYADVLRELFGDEKRIADITLATAVKFPAEMFEMLARVYSLSPAECLPVKTLAVVVDSVLSSRGSEAVDAVVKFCLSCAEAAFLLCVFFGDTDVEAGGDADADDGGEAEDVVESERPSKVTPIVEEFHARKLAGDPRLLWPACVLRFLNHPAVDESLSDGSLQPIIDDAFQNELRVAAALLLCPDLKSLRIPVDRRPLVCELDATTSLPCVNCELLKTKLEGSEAAKDAMARSVSVLRYKIRSLQAENANMAKKVRECDHITGERKAEVTAIQAQVNSKDRKIEELKAVGKQFENELAEQRNKNQETMTVLKQARRETEKARSDFERKRAECQQLQRELSAGKEQLAAARKKIEELESFKEKLSSLMGSFSK